MVAPPSRVALPEIGPSAMTARELVLDEVVAMSCITESLSTALLRALRDAADDARVREVLSEILKDEVAANRARGRAAFTT